MRTRSRRVGKLGIGAALIVAAGGTLAPAARGQVWQPGNRLLPNPRAAQAEAAWGRTIATGDFDGDGFDDLVTGAPDEDVLAGGGPTLFPNAGTAAVFLGEPAGLRSFRDLGLNGVSNDANVGFALATGDFDDDGRDELAVAAPGTSWDGVERSGEVRVHTRPAGNWVLDSTWHQGENLPGDNMPFDQIGQSLATGDFDGDGFDDLVIGVPGENVTPGAGPEVLDAGAILVLYGSLDGLSTSGIQLLHEASPGMPGPQANARFGFSLAVGDFDDDFRDDLVVGVPFFDAPGQADSGQIVILRGSASGLTTAGHQRFDDADFAGGAVAAGDQFGYALATGLFRSTGACPVGSCFESLLIGIPGEPSIGGATSAGGFVEAHGSDGGITPSGAIFWSQDGLGAAANNAETGDRFGAVIVAGELDGRDGTDVVVGVPVEDWTSRVDQGLIHLLFGGYDGLVVTYPGQWRIQDGFASGPGLADDRFGAALGIGDFNGDGTGDLAASAPGRTVDGEANAGVIQLFRGAIFADGFENGTTGVWSSSLP